MTRIYPISHVGIIPDGNRRWAEAMRASLSESYGIGFSRVIQVARHLNSRGIQTTTFYGLSTDNYCKRPPDQVELMLTRIIDSMLIASPLLKEEGICVHFLGALDELDTSHQLDLRQIEESTRTSNRKNALNILVNYNPQWDLKGKQRLKTAEVPPCDLVVRTGGMKRLSGFLPIQTAAADLYFTDILWPDVKLLDLDFALSQPMRQPRGA